MISRRIQVNKVVLLRVVIVIAEHISDRQTIVQQVWRYSKILFLCTGMYIYYVCKNSVLLIVDLNLIVLIVPRLNIHQSISIAGEYIQRDNEV